MCVKVRDWDACDSQQIARANDAPESRPIPTGKLNQTEREKIKEKSKMEYDVAISLAKKKKRRRI